MIFANCINTIQTLEIKRVSNTAVLNPLISIYSTCGRIPSKLLDRFKCFCLVSMSVGRKVFLTFLPLAHIFNQYSSINKKPCKNGDYVFLFLRKEYEMEIRCILRGSEIKYFILKLSYRIILQVKPVLSR